MNHWQTQNKNCQKPETSTIWQILKILKMFVPQYVIHNTTFWKSQNLYAPK